MDPTYARTLKSIGVCLCVWHPKYFNQFSNCKVQHSYVATSINKTRIPMFF